MRNSLRKSRRWLGGWLSLALLMLAGGAGVVASVEVAGGAPLQEVERITIAEFKSLFDRGTGLVVLDVRGAGVETKIKGAQHIPLDQLERRLKEIPRDREVVTYCS